MKRCTVCGREYSDEYRFCSSDATPLETIPSANEAAPEGEVTADAEAGNAPASAGSAHLPRPVVIGAGIIATLIVGLTVGVVLARGSGAGGKGAAPTMTAAIPSADTESETAASDSAASERRFEDKALWTAEASSTDDPYADGQNQRTVSYLPQFLCDGKLSTAWSEGADGDGEGEWVRVRFPAPRTVTKVELLPGYAKDHPRFGNLFSLNNRLQEARFSFSDGSSQSHTFTDARQMQAVELSAPVTTEWVEVRIVSVYPSQARRPGGERWRDTPLSEIEVWGYENGPGEGSAEAESGNEQSSGGHGE